MPDLQELVSDTITECDELVNPFFEFASSWLHLSSFSHLIGSLSKSSLKFDDFWSSFSVVIVSDIFRLQLVRHVIAFVIFVFNSQVEWLY